MNPLRKLSFRIAAFWLASLVLGACAATHPAQPVAAGAASITPRQALWTNTFPAIKDNGATLRFLHYSLEQGLSQSSAQVILQDSQGFLWAGTQDGLDRFDGYGFTVFRSNPADPHALSGSEILSMAQGRDGSLWIGTEAGLNRYDPITGSFSHWRHDDRNPGSLINDTVQAVYEDARGVLWVGTQGGLDTFDPASGRFDHFHMLDKPAGSGNADAINALYEDEDHTLWVGTNDGLVRYGLDDRRFQRYQNESGEGTGLSFNEVCCISPDQSGALWVGTHAGLHRIDPTTGSITIFAHSADQPGSLGDDYIESTYIDRSHELWVGTRNGLDRFNPTTQQFIHYRNDPTDATSLSSNTVSSIYEDRGGILWVGTFNGGLNEHDRSQDRFAFYHHVNADPDSLSGDSVFPIVPAANGQLWIGTYSAGLNLFDPATGRSEHFLHDAADPDSLGDDTVLSLFIDKNQTLWVGTHRGLDRLLPASPKFGHSTNQPQDLQSIPPGTVYAILEDYLSTYWVGTSHGLRAFDPVSGKFTRLQSSGADPTPLNESTVLAIYQDHSGILWFGTNTHGLYRFNPITRELQQFMNIPGDDSSLSSNSVLSIFEDSHGEIWIATFGGGLDRYVPAQSKFVSYRLAQGLPNDVVYGVQEDRSGALWLSTNVGISKFEPSTGQFENFTVKDGLQSNEFDSSAFATDADGRMYFGGVKGLTVFDPAEIQKNSYIPPLVLTSLTTQEGKPVVPVQSAESLRDVTLSYPQNSFDLSFAALSFSHVEGNQYQYMLQGFDQGWHNAGADHRGGYTNLPGGTYTLRIIGANSDGVWNQVGTSVKVTVVPPIWQTWGFRGFAIIALVLAALVGYRSRVQGIQAQKTALEHIVVERTRELQQQNLDLEALYSADEKLLRVLTQDEALQVLVDVAVDVLQADKCAVFTRAQGETEYTVRIARGFSPEAVRSAGFSTFQQAVLAKAADGEAISIRDIADDNIWRRQRSGVIGIMTAEGMRSLMYIPIRVQGTVFGILNVCSAAPGRFSEDRQRLFGSLVQRTALSIENGRLFEQTRHMAILEERNRLAQELHDSAKQRAFAALAQLGAAKKLVDQNDASAAEHVGEAENIVSEVIHDLTYFIQESYPGALKEKGLVPSLEEYAFSWEGRSGIPLSVSIEGERRLPLRVEQALYKVVQEGLSNIARHSQATQATLEVTYQPQEIQIRIADNGKGFDLASTAEGLGLPLIQERLESIGGHVRIESRGGGGTLLTVRVPVPAEEIEVQNG